MEMKSIRHRIYTERSTLPEGLLHPGDDSHHEQGAHAVYDHGMTKNIKLRLPWGAHITVNRFLEMRSPEELHELRDYFASLNDTTKAQFIGESRPFAVDVGHFILTPKGFEFKVYDRKEIASCNTSLYDH